jgi:hypothetical protein
MDRFAANSKVAASVDFVRRSLALRRTTRRMIFLVLLLRRRYCSTCVLLRVNDVIWLAGLV